jgi:hypothetical protein
VPRGPALQLALLRRFEAKGEAVGFHAGHKYKLQMLGKRRKLYLAGIEDERR